jgi:RNA polymerase sigma factor (sigma-70 family)
MPNESLIAGWRNRWHQNLSRFLGRRVRARVDIEDLAQETYLRLLRARDLGDIRNPQAYLLRVAGNVLNEWRQHQPRPESIVMMDDDLVADEASPEFELEASISQERLEAALAAVSPTMRAVLLLRLRDELPCGEIAAKLEVTERQVKRHLARGYEKLRAALEN